MSFRNELVNLEDQDTNPAGVMDSAPSGPMGPNSDMLH